MYSTATNNVEFVLDPYMKSPLPCTAIAFRPDTESFKQKNVLVASYADGKIRHWHYTSGKEMGKAINDNPDTTNHVSYRADGEYFATVGTDLKVRGYDAHTFQSVFEASYGYSIITQCVRQQLWAFKPGLLRQV
jgi:WD40 repeat protein